FKKLCFIAAREAHCCPSPTLERERSGFSFKKKDMSRLSNLKALQKNPLEDAGRLKGVRRR
ncbi:MAG: hypothetical protein JSW15_06075, partial [Deltaproteobacteria bacterium]